MFQAVGLKLEGEHLDLDFRDTSAWTLAGPQVPIPNQWIVVGDPDSGPAIMLGTPGTFPKEIWMDTHYHGSDQFRAVIKGEYLLQTHRMGAGDFGYQESGRIYREGLSDADEGCWIFAMHGNWRGARTTPTRRDGDFDEVLYDNQLDRYAQTMDDSCWWNVPGGPKGIRAIKTTLKLQAGWAWGNFDDPEGWRPLTEGVQFTAGVFGLPETGPILLTIKAEPGRVAVPPAVCGAEVVCVVIGGSAEIGGKPFQKGELRVQSAGVPLEAVVSGPDGLNMVYLIADRRHRLQFSADDASSIQWRDTFESVCSELLPSAA